MTQGSRTDSDFWSQRGQHLLFYGSEPFFLNDVFFEIVAFTLSANDQAGLSGNCFFTPIPPTALLLGRGMLGMALQGWRRSRQS